MRTSGTPSGTAPADGTAVAVGTAPAGSSAQGGVAPSAGAAAPVVPLATSNDATEGVAEVAPETDVEQQAATLARAAIQREYRAGRYRIAEKKLREAVSLCLEKGCSVPFRARLNRDLGILYVGGMKRGEAGKDEFATALTADPTVAIPKPLNTRPINTAFVEVRRALAEEESPGQTVAPTAPAAARGQLDVSTPYSGGTGESDNGSANWRNVANWITLGFQQDFMIHSATQYVCNEGSRYVCYDSNLTEVSYNTGGYYNGNEISSSGLRLASSRILVGFERLLFKNMGIGLKGGALIAGAAPRRATDPVVQRFHGELRLSLYPGSDPFGPTTHVRPYFFGSVGTAETDSPIIVEVVTSTATYRYKAWKRGGNFFAGGGLGVAFPIRQSNGPFVEARFVSMLGARPASTLAAMGGYSIGF